MPRSRTQRQEKYLQFYKSVCTIEVSRARGVESKEILANSEGNKKSERVQAKNSRRVEKKERERERADGYGMLVGSTVGKVGHLRPRIEEEFEL